MAESLLQRLIRVVNNPNDWLASVERFVKRKLRPEPPQPELPADQYKFDPMPVNEDQQREVLEFRDRIDELQALPYPTGYVISSRWSEIAELSVRNSRLQDDARAIAYFGMNSFDVGFSPNPDVEGLTELKARYLQRHPELASVEESPLVPSDRVVDHGGVRFSHSLAQAFSYYTSLSDGIGNETMDVVVEIGSGFGRFVRLLKLAGRGRRFVLVDLPESLLFGFSFLRLHFPDAKMRVLRSEADCVLDIPGDYEFTFCPIQLLHCLRPVKVDLVVNTYSLGEMQQSCVDHITAQIDSHLRPRFFFSINTMFTNKNLHYTESGNLGEGSDAVLNLKPQWWPVSFKLWNDTLENEAWRSTAHTVLRRVTMTTKELTSKLLTSAEASAPLSDDHLAYLYFAALDPSDATVRDRLFSALRDRHIADGFQSGRGYNFDAIGEVKFLRAMPVPIVG